MKPPSSPLEPVIAPCDREANAPSLAAPAPAEVVSAEEFRTCLRVLESVARDRTLLVDVATDDRRALMEAASRVSMPTDDEERTLRRAFRRQERKVRQAKDAVVIATTGMRAQRRALVQPVAVLPPASVSAPDDAPEAELGASRNCYVCKAPYYRVHAYYDAMCVPCGDFNYAKRTQTADLTGRVALLTGSRLKIGYHAALMLLRAGATVIATTRFPQDSAQRFAREPGFEAWGARLRVYGLDLRHTPSVELFCRYLLRREEKLDFLINNAAQTVRRPPRFYAHMLAGEQRPVASLPPAERAILRGHDEVSAAFHGAHQLAARGTDAPVVFETWQRREPGVGLWGSAQLSQVPYDIDDATPGDDVFPRGLVDVDQQQVDLRETNSWRLRLADVPTPELLEVHLVNVVAPFVLNSRLKPLMLAHPTRDRHIVNVSAVEGQFARGTKTDRHPHTNMAKAALNMMTRTSASDYARHGIFMNSVDTGWVTDEDPAALVARKVSEQGFEPPLDVIDGAARILDPIFDGLRTGHHIFGKFLKDYRPTEW